MKLKELKNKTSEELNKIYRDCCGNMQELRFKVANQQLKNIREVRTNRKTIARALTLLKILNQDK